MVGRGAMLEAYPIPNWVIPRVPAKGYNSRLSVCRRAPHRWDWHSIPWLRHNSRITIATVSTSHYTVQRTVAHQQGLRLCASQLTVAGWPAVWKILSPGGSRTTAPQVAALLA